jgi:hypothetical protein
VVTFTSLIDPPKSYGHEEQVTLVPVKEHVAHPVGHYFNVTVVFNFSE